jgi:hypothetical protein
LQELDQGMAIKALPIVHDDKQSGFFDSDGVECAQGAFVVVDAMMRVSGIGRGATQQGMEHR